MARSHYREHIEHNLRRLATAHAETAKVEDAG
jgi:hypothetical protein